MSPDWGAKGGRAMQETSVSTEMDKMIVNLITTGCIKWRNSEFLTCKGFNFDQNRQTGNFFNLLENVLFQIIRKTQ